MPLSEHEQRLLDQMEQQLYDDDPKLAGRLAQDPQQVRTRKRLVVGGGVLLLGLALVVLGVASSQIWIGGIGFIVMVAGGVYSMTPGRTRLGTVGDQGEVTEHKPRSGGRLKKSLGGVAPSGSGGFMERMEQRWEKRRREGGGW